MLNCKNFLTALLTLAFVIPTQLQAQSFEEGSKAIDLGVGFGGSGRYLTGYDRNGISPTFLASMDFGVKKAGPGVIGIGGLVGLKGSRSSSIYGDYRTSDLILGVRGNYHWNEWHGREDLDFYAGVMLGMNIRLTDRYEYNSYYYNNSNAYRAANTLANNYPVYQGYVGVRYLFTKVFGVYAEVGPGVTIVNGGFTFLF